MDFPVKATQLSSPSWHFGAGLTLFSGLSASNEVTKHSHRDPKVTTVPEMATPVADYCMS